MVKKNGKLYFYIDFRDLNKATSKDKYPISIANTLIDAAIRHRLLSFVDDHPRHNQIFIAEEDVHKITFQCLGLIGMFEWIVMFFGLKNAGAIY